MIVYGSSVSPFVRKVIAFAAAKGIEIEIEVKPLGLGSDDPVFLKRARDKAVADAAECDELPPLLAYLEGVIPASNFLVEDRLTLADIAVASPFANLRHMKVAVDPATYPKLTRYVDSILARPSFKPWVDREAGFLEKVTAA